jgi:hypothetical protein
VSLQVALPPPVVIAAAQDIDVAFPFFNTVKVEVSVPLM